MSYNDDDLKTDSVDHEEEFNPEQDPLDEHFLDDDDFPLGENEEEHAEDFAGLDGSSDY